MNYLKNQDNSEQDSILEKSVSLIASAISDPSRVRILCALMDGRAWTATELSAIAEIAASTASGHLQRLLNNGLVTCFAQGRHRYYRLAGPHIAGLLENLMNVSMHPLTFPEPRTPKNLRYARTCYDHLAGELAVNIYTFMLEEKWLNHDGTALTTTGNTHFEQMGAVCDPRPRRKSCCPCLDWSERRNHLGGDAGAALLTLFLQKKWITHMKGYREVNITTSGKAALLRLFNLSTNSL